MGAGGGSDPRDPQEVVDGYGGELTCGGRGNSRGVGDVKNELRGDLISWLD